MIRTWRSGPGSRLAVGLIAGSGELFSFSTALDEGKGEASCAPSPRGLRLTRPVQGARRDDLGEEPQNSGQNFHRATIHWLSRERLRIS
ncbi:Hypothetical protein BN69_2167 [Methylocystis sp. SC2]|nr:Hypothetical protein BN69_2167 [Methylocystis sp. SC2]